MVASLYAAGSGVELGAPEVRARMPFLRHGVELHPGFKRVPSWMYSSLYYVFLSLFFYFFFYILSS